MKIKLFIIYTLIFLIGSGTYAQESSAAYLKSLDEWHAKRIGSLKSENGWLNLEGLFWLEQGSNSFGSGKQNAIVFPAGSISAAAGYFEVKGFDVKLVTAADAGVTLAGKPVKEAMIFNADSMRSATMSHGPLRWTLIKRDNKIGVRLRNLESKQLKEFKGVERFAADTSLRITAILQEGVVPATIPITNVLGQTTQNKLAGKLIFKIAGQQLTLDALEEGDELFIIFGDETSAVTTYPSGRFLYANKPGADGKVVLDFNKAINPPCAFTDFATCPLPPKQNILKVEITAGEKYHPNSPPAKEGQGP
ncbi:MAG: DUF1684 domain-containing protein [Chitinophagaceae bacterium]|nr:MAG: DUF1684 domain-containing protein [Chitinophagaceae bacterium]